MITTSEYIIVQHVVRFVIVNIGKRRKKRENERINEKKNEGTNELKYGRRMTLNIIKRIVLTFLIRKKIKIKKKKSISHKEARAKRASKLCQSITNHRSINRRIYISSFLLISLIALPLLSRFTLILSFPFSFPFSYSYLDLILFSF